MHRTARASRRRARLWDALIKLVDLQHLLNGSHARDRLFGKLANAIGNRAQQFTVNVYRAATHARHHAGELRLLAQQLHQYYVTLGAVQVAEYAQHFHSHGFRLGTLKNRIANSLHPRTHVVHLHNLRWCGIFLGGQAGGAGLGMAQTKKNEENA